MPTTPRCLQRSHGPAVLAITLAMTVAAAGCTGSDDEASAPATTRAQSSGGAETSGTSESSSTSESSGSPLVGAAASVGRFASPNPGSVNTYWLSAPEGLIVVDAGRNVSGGRTAVDKIEQTGVPVVAIVITHPHPDHVGGLGVLHEAWPDVPIYASVATTRWMRADPLDFYALARQADPDFPAALTYPDHTFQPGAVLDLGGLSLETTSFAAGESATATSYFEPQTQTLFSGDLTDNEATPALLEGHTCGWLLNLQRLAARYPDADTAYPGHGAPAPASRLLADQTSYLLYYRALVGTAVQPASPAGLDLAPAESTSIVADLDAHFPGYPPVASLPDLQTVNVAAVAAELATERGEAIPSACRA